MIGFAMCGSFCNFKAAFLELEKLIKSGEEVVPIMSYNVYSTDTRFGNAADFIDKAQEMCGRKVVHTLSQAEPLGPKIKLDCMCICPCTGNTLAKLAHSIADGPVTMAAKSHLRNGRPILLAVSTNDGLAGAAENIGRLLSRKHYFFVPFGQDDPQGKPTSLVADFTKIPEALTLAAKGKQIQPMLT